MLHLEKKCHMCWCVCYFEGTSKQFSDTFHSHAEHNINSSKLLSLKFLQKEAHVSFCPSKNYGTNTKGTFETTHSFQNRHKVNALRQN